MRLSVRPRCSCRHSRLWLTPRGCCLLKHLHPCPEEAATHRQRGSAARVVGDIPNVAPHTGAMVERGARRGGSGHRGRWRRSSGCRMGSAAHITLPRGSVGSGTPECFGTPRLPHNSAAERGVLPLLPEQQHSEKPPSLITLMQVRAGGWYWLRLLAPAACRAEPGRGASLRSLGSVSPRWEEGPCNLLYRCPQAQIFWGESPSPITSQPRPRAPGWTQNSGTTGTYHHHARRHCPSAGEAWPGRQVGSHPAFVLVPPKTATNRGFFQEAPLPVPCHPFAGTQASSWEPGTSLAGAATAEGHGTRDRRERRGRELFPPLLTAPDPVAFSGL